MATEVAYSAYDIFDAFLREQLARHGNEWPRRDPQMHRAFYKAKEAFPDEMQKVEFLLRTAPYCHQLADIIVRYRQAGILTSDEGRTITLLRADELSEPDDNLRKVAKFICDLLPK
jgi:hypothetical protein